MLHPLQRTGTHLVKKAITLCLKGRANSEEMELFSDMPKEFQKQFGEMKNMELFSDMPKKNPKIVW